MHVPQGAGFWIWKINRCTKDMTPDHFAVYLRDLGIRWVTLKIADGVNPPKLAALWSPAKLAPYIAAIRKEGLGVWGWHYVYGWSPEKEAQVGADQVKAMGLDGYIIDAEAEYQTPAKARAAEIYMRGLRQRLGSDYPIALSTYRYPSYHTPFPWNSFKGVDLWMPQVYWVKGSHPAYQLRKSKTEYDDFKKLPFVPVGSAYSEWGWSPKAFELKEFAQACKELGLPGYSWWELACAQPHQDWMDVISLMAGKERTTPISHPPGTIAVPKKAMVTAQRGLIIRSEPSVKGIRVGSLSYRQVVTIEETRNNWGRLAGVQNQWICLDYTQAVK